MKKLLVGLSIGGLGAIFGALIARLAMHNAMLKSTLVAFKTLTWADVLIGLPLSMFLVILLHEAGHLAGGISRGMRFLLLIVGPLRLRRTVSGLKLDWFLHSATLGGLAAATPNPARPNKAQFLCLVIGGPLSSLLLAVFALALASQTEGRLSAHVLIFGLLSFAIFAVTAAPMRAGGFMSDGWQAIELLRGGEAVEQRNAFIAVFGESLAGVRPRDRDRAPLERGLALTGKEPLRDVGLWLFAYHAALDRRDVIEAGQWLDRVAAGYEAFPPGFRQGLACEIAFFAARYRHELEAADAWLARTKGGTVDESIRALAEAAVAAARGDTGTALQAIERGERALRDSSDAGTMLLVKDELQALREAIETSDPPGIRAKAA